MARRERSKQFYAPGSIRIKHEIARLCVGYANANDGWSEIVVFMKV